MSRRKLDLHIEPTLKRKKTFSTTETNSILTMPLDDAPDHITLSAYEKDANSTVREAPNAETPTSNSNKNCAEELQISRKQTDDYHEQTVATFVPDQMHIDELPPELLMDVFDYLSLNDLRAVRQTSKGWREIAGSHFHINFSSMLALACRHRRYKPRKTAAFTQFIQRIQIFGMDQFQRFVDKTPNFQQLKTIRFVAVNLTGLKLDHMKHIFNNIQHLEIDSCVTDEHSVDYIMAATPNLKRLALCQNEIGSEWYNRKYPTLEACALIKYADTEYEPTAMHNVPISIFLENNPNIREFAVYADVLMENRQSIQIINVKLDVLHVHVNTMVETRLMCLALNEFYELGVFKRLHLYINFREKLITDTDLALLKGLQHLCMHYLNIMGTWDEEDLKNMEPFQLKPIQHLEELSVDNLLHIKDIEASATNHQNLQRIHANYANFTHVALFIKNQKKLKEIVIESFDNAEMFQELIEGGYVDYFEFVKNAENGPKFIDLCMLNRERSKLLNAVKVTLYVKEPLYLATKWAMKGTVDLQYIMLKRIESFEMYYGLFHDRNTFC